MSFNNFVNTIRNYEFKYIQIDINSEFCRSKCGILRAIQILFGLICFLTILITCYNNYDPYSGSYMGFVGGKAETAFLLISWSSLMWSSITMLCYIFSIHSANNIPKTPFEITLNSFSFSLYLLISVILLIEVSTRNAGDINGLVEPGFVGKIFASIFGLINTIIYGFSIFYFYKLYKTLLDNI
ncbi:uncharacterized protein LOC128961571 [Oppia nitens]|uniref:uncharacterized protein LOC128961571 n=1 Tax=Oppia nitens TaxID=1686743 RepID=UPI0023D9CE7B|nr:uncharacterized protein LOC128961571 [Oppia nitens]